MKILVVSHNCFSSSTNMGKTLGYYFSSFGKENIAQFFLYAEHPDSNEISNNYFRFTDFDAIKSIIFRGRYGCVVRPKFNNTQRVDSKAEDNIYKAAKTKTPFKYFLRDMIWKLSSWNSKRFDKWVKDFRPDVVFYASGDSAFSYKLALNISRKYSLPLIVSCMDDYYFYNVCGKSIISKVRQKIFMKNVLKTMRYASGIVCYTKKMAVDYQSLFNRPTLFYRHFDVNRSVNKHERKGIVYVGNLGLNRWKNLVKIGKCLNQLNISPLLNHIDVYSATQDESILSEMCRSEGISFKGKISAEEVKNVLNNAKYAIHTESRDYLERVNYSFSTKILETIYSGVCLIAYGPSSIASIREIEEVGTAYVISDEDDLGAKLKELLTDESVSSGILDKVNNSKDKDVLFCNDRVFKNWLEEIISRESNSNQ